MLEINKNPGAKDLAWFGVTLTALLGVIGAVVWWNGGEASFGTTKAIWWAAGIFAAIYYLVRPVQRFAFIGFMYLVYPIGFVMSYVIMGLIFCGANEPLMRAA